MRKLKGEQPGAVGAWLHRGGSRDGKNLGGSQPWVPLSLPYSCLNQVEASVFLSVFTSLYLTLNATISGKEGKNLNCCFIMKSQNNWLLKWQGKGISFLEHLHSSYCVLGTFHWSHLHSHSTAPLSMGFSRQEYWNGLPFPSPGDLPDPEKPIR